MKMIMRTARTKKSPRMYRLNHHINDTIFLTSSCWTQHLTTSIKHAMGDNIIYRSMLNKAERFTNNYI